MASAARQDPDCRQPLGGAAGPGRAFGDAFGFGEAPGLEQSREREVATDGVETAARRLDHGVAGAADADVDQRSRVEQSRRLQPGEICHPPVLELVAVVRGELRIEVRTLSRILRLLLDVLLRDKQRNAVDDAQRPTLEDPRRRVDSRTLLALALRP